MVARLSLPVPASGYLRDGARYSRNFSGYVPYYAQGIIGLADVERGGFRPSGAGTVAGQDKRDRCASLRRQHPTQAHLTAFETPRLPLETVKLQLFKIPTSKKIRNLSG